MQADSFCVHCSDDEFLDIILSEGIRLCRSAHRLVGVEGPLGTCLFVGGKAHLAIKVFSHSFLPPS